MGRKKGRRTKSDDGGSHRSGAPGFPDFAHGQYTFEGEIERLSRGMSGKDRMPKAASVALLVAILAPLVVLAVSLLVRLVNALF